MTKGKKSAAPASSGKAGKNLEVALDDLVSTGNKKGKGKGKGKSNRSEPYDTGKSSGKGRKSGGVVNGKMTTKTVFFANAPWETTEGYLRKQFERYGTITDFELFRRADGGSIGNGLCTFARFEEARAAIENLHESMVDGRNIVVKEDEQGGGKGGKGGKGGSGWSSGYDNSKSKGSWNKGSSKGGKAGGRSSEGFQLQLSNIPAQVRWQDLKDVFSELFDVTFTSVDGYGNAVLELSNERDALKIIQKYNGGNLNGHPIRVRWM